MRDRGNPVPFLTSVRFEGFVMLRKFADVFCFVWIAGMILFFMDWIVDILAQ
jgi:hypothetical protein